MTTTAPPDFLLGEPTARDMVRADVPVFDVADSALAAYAVVSNGRYDVALVSRGEVPIGLVDEGALHRAATRILLGEAGVTVGSCMPSRCVRISLDAPLPVVAEQLLRSPNKAALATDHGTVVGVVTAAGLLRAVSHPSPHQRTADAEGRSEAGHGG